MNYKKEKRNRSSGNTKRLKRRTYGRACMWNTLSLQYDRREKLFQFVLRLLQTRHKDYTPGRQCLNVLAQCKARLVFELPLSEFWQDEEYEAA